MSSSTETSLTTSDPPVPRDCRAVIPPHLVATPTFGPGGSFSIISSIHITAPPDTVFKVLTDHARWPEWNRFVRKATVQSSPDDNSSAIGKDMDLAIQVHMDPLDPESSPRTETIHVTVLEPYEEAAGGQKGWRIAWKATSLPSFALRAERVQEFVDDGRGNTEYTCWETMYGPLAPVVRWMVGSKLEVAFQCWAEDLKKRAEETVKGGDAAPLS